MLLLSEKWNKSTQNKDSWEKVLDKEFSNENVNRVNIIEEWRLIYGNKVRSFKNQVRKVHKISSLG